ncbi:MAG: hypothetical protein JO372_14040, partial [Solirubrobacterales bacterium]|nr:hypothetical protein [Solirubrobacterales bacterium]
MRGGSFAMVDAAGKLLAFAVVAVLTRRQSAHTFGLVVAGIAGAGIVQTVLDGGLGFGLARAAARREDAISTIAGSRVLLATSLALPASVAMLVLGSSKGVWAASVACGATSAALPVTALVAAHRLRYASIALTGPNVLFLIVVLVLPGATATEILAAFAGCNAACAAITLGVADIRPRYVSLATACRSYVQYSANAVYSVASTIYGRIDTVALAVVGQVTAAGLYGTYYRVVLAVVGLMSWLSPLAFRLLADADTFHEGLVWLEKRLAWVAVSVSVVLLVGGPPVLSLLTHGRHLPWIASTSLALVAIPTILAAPLAGALIINDRSRRLAEISIVVLVLACGLYAVLIPLLAVDGAALASLLTETVALGLLWHETILLPPKGVTAPGSSIESTEIWLSPGRFGVLGPSGRPRISAPAVYGVAVSVAVSLLVGGLAGLRDYVPIAVAAALVLAAALVCFPGAGVGSACHRKIVTVIFAIYLCPLVMFGRIFALLGHKPVYLPDLLLMGAVLVMVPLSGAALRKVSPVPLLCVAVAVFALHAVYVGTEHGYPAAIKGVVLAFYPVVALVTAAWLSTPGEAERLLAALARYVLPLAGVGLALTLAAGGTIIPASYGLYLGVAAAFAATPRVPHRRVLALATLAGAILLVASSAERGVAVTVVVAPLAAWIAAARSRSGLQTPLALFA